MANMVFLSLPKSREFAPSLSVLKKLLILAPAVPKTFISITKNAPKFLRFTPKFTNTDDKRIAAFLNPLSKSMPLEKLNSQVLNW